MVVAVQQFGECYEHNDVLVNRKADPAADRP
jgi:hypothetical protein